MLLNIIIHFRRYLIAAATEVDKKNSQEKGKGRGTKEKYILLICDIFQTADRMYVYWFCVQYISVILFWWSLKLIISNKCPENIFMFCASVVVKAVAELSMCWD